MAAARPVVSTQVAGIPESVVAGETGFLVPPANAVALAEALAQLVGDPSLRERLGRAGRARLEENFTINKTIMPLVQLLRRSPAAEKKPSARPRIKQIVYLIDRWPDDAVPMLEWELKEMKWRNIAILPIVCEFDSQAHLLNTHEAVASTLEFLPDAMAIEAEWLSNQALARKLEDAHAAAEQRVPAGLFLREARFALSLRKLLLQKNVSHIHATSSRALLCAIILQSLADFTVSATIEPRPPVSQEWIKIALRNCRGGRSSDFKLIRRRGSSFLFDKAAARKSLRQRLMEKIGIDLTGYGSFWQEWSELLVRWNRERPEQVKIDH
jgi:hypothetical protein